jgi:uncharacterized protein YdeI (YjbR/CyaY-like superfamily)
VKTITYEEAVEECLCFGWIDSTAKSIDENRTMQMMTPRKPKSVWSALNKKRVAKLIELGLMTEAGLEKIEIAKKNGQWNAMDEVDALKVPKDLKAALAKNPTAKENYESFSNSNQKSILRWLVAAKREDTRKKRVEEAIMMLERNETLYKRNGKKEDK